MERVALITGIKRIGKAIALDLIDDGWNLAVLYRDSSDVAGEIDNHAKEKGRLVHQINADLSIRETWRRAVGETVERFGRIDALIHLASPYERKNIDSLTPEEFDRYMNIIAGSFIFMSIEARRYMLSNEGEVKGRIIAFGDWSVDATPYRGFAHYFVAKGALHTAVRVLAKEFAPSVLVNCIAPGPVIKPEDMSTESWDKLLSGTPLKREVTIEDVIAGLKLFLYTSSITGEVLRIDSGRHIAGSGIGSVEG